MRTDNDLKFWEIKYKALRYVCIVQNLYNYKIKTFFEKCFGI